MESDENADTVTGINTFASQTFLQIEIFTYMVLGALLALTALVGIGGAGVSLWTAAQEQGSPSALVFTIDRLLFVLMVVEILHTVRVSFRSGELLCEPFLIVGLPRSGACWSSHLSRRRSTCRADGHPSHRNCSTRPCWNWVC